MKRQILISALVAGAALTALGGCASYDTYDRGYYGNAYYGGGYYAPEYYGPDYYGGIYQGPAYVPRGGFGGGDHRDRHDRDGARHDGDHRDFRRSDNDGSRNISRNQPQQTVTPAQQPSSGGGWHGGRDGGAQPGGARSGGTQTSGSGGSQSGGRSSGGPQGPFGHPGTHNNPL